MKELLSNINWWIVIVVFTICYLISMFKTVSEKEMGLAVLWGRILWKLRSGPVLIPWPMRVIKVTKNAIKVDFGTLDESDVERANRADASQSWFVLAEPIRINWGDIQSSDDLTEDQRKQYENDPLAKRLTTDPHLYFIFRVFDLTHLVEEAGDLNAAIARIQDTCITALQEEAGKTFVAKAIKEIDLLSDKIRKEVEWLVGDPDAECKDKKPNRSWGVDVLEVRIKDLGTSHAVNIAVSSRSAKVAEAAGDATATELRAKAEQTRLTKEGEGRAAAKKVEGEAEASAISARAKAVSEPGGELVAKLDALQSGLEHGKTVILPADLSILTTATSIKTVLDAVGKKEGE